MQNGFLRVRSVFDPLTVSLLAAAVDAAVADSGNSAWDGAWRDNPVYNNPDAPQLRTLHHIEAQSPVWAGEIGGVLQALAAALLGRPVVFHQSTVVVKPALDGQAFPLHQDVVYFGAADVPYVSLSVHLDDTTPENGPLRFVPGSHLAGVRSHARPLGGKSVLVEGSMDDTVEVCARAGDVVAFSHLTVHASYPNRSDRPRRLVRVGYHAQ